MTSPGMTSSHDVWPDLTLSTWDDTRYSFHMWSQIVGKVRLALEPHVNHWWQVPLYVSARGLTTSLMHAGATGLEIEFDLLDDVLVMRMTDGRQRHIALEPRSVASFYAETMEALADLGVHVTFLERPVEVAESIPFAQDQQHRDFDSAAARRFWIALVQAHRVMWQFRARFTGKVSPVHFFWGAFDLAVTRFSGGDAPEHPGGVPHCATWVQIDAYSHEVSSCGFWPGGSTEGSFYAYAYPEPDGFAEWNVTPNAAYYDQTLREFILPYTAVRAADDPDAYLLSFFQSTYEAEAELAGWDRADLEARR
jgi:Family of unknown function (DUF5996)